MKIGVITTSRADYSIYLPLLRKIQSEPKVDLFIFALGMHVNERFGFTYKRILEDGFNVILSSDILVSEDSSWGISKSLGATTIEMGHLIAENKMDLFLCLGDRFEMFAAVSAVIPFNIPIGHIHGGENTFGAIDEKFRHAITKLSDYHFTSCEKYRKNVIQMGTNPDRVFNVGSLGIENLKNSKIFSLSEIKKEFGIDLEISTILATFHPVTTELEKNNFYISEFYKVIEELDYQFAITLSNADTKGKMFREKLIEMGEKHPERVKVFENLGPEGYPNFLKYCKLMIGNSSSGIVEAASANLPVVNIGNRQKGRACSNNVVHTGYSKEEILDGIQKAEKLIGTKFKNIYEGENPSGKILEILKKIDKKPHYDFYQMEYP